jgi:hypothetical protein
MVYTDMAILEIINGTRVTLTDYYSNETHRPKLQYDNAQGLKLLGYEINYVGQYVRAKFRRLLQPRPSLNNIYPH